MQNGWFLFFVFVSVMLLLVLFCIVFIVNVIIRDYRKNRRKYKKK